MRPISFVLTCLLISACGRPEDPARVELRARLKQNVQLSNEDLGRMLDEVRLAVAGNTFRIKEGAATKELDAEQRAVIFGMLTNSSGMYDEGLRLEAGGAFRVLNAPGSPLNSEIEGTRRLWIDVETFLPRRFDFAYAVPGFGDYSFELVVVR